jgi:hypothetical protein
MLRAPKFRRFNHNSCFKLEPSETIKPTIEKFKKDNGVTPNKYLKQFLAPIFSDLPGGFELKNFQHYGNNKLHEFVWACIYYKYPEVKSLYASSSPQLYVLVHSNGIKFGFDYGAQIHKEDSLVTKVNKSRELQNIVVEATKSIDSFKLEQGADYLAKEVDKVTLHTPEKVKSDWDNTIHIIKQYNKEDIPEQIEKEIVDTLTILKPLFIKISGGKESSKETVEDDYKNRL